MRTVVISWCIVTNVARNMTEVGEPVGPIKLCSTLLASLPHEYEGKAPREHGLGFCCTNATKLNSQSRTVSEDARTLGCISPSGAALALGERRERRSTETALMVQLIVELLP